MLPAEWKPWVRSGKSLAYIGPVRKDSTPNILMNVVPLTGKVKDYASAELESMKKVWSNLEMMEEGPCQTQSGLQGYKMVFKRKVPDGSRTLLNRYYFFSLQQDRCLIFLATSSDVFGNELDALFEECAHSIESK